VLFQLVSTGVSHHDSVSSSEEMKKLLTAATEQTYVLKQGFAKIEQQLEKVEHSFKKPTNRRAWVNYERRKQIRKRRLEFSGARSH
jgi:hypothetical protein